VSELDGESAEASRLGRVLVLCNIVILVLLAFAAARILYVSHATHAAQAQQAAENLARILSLSLAGEIRLVDNALRATRDAVDDLPADTERPEVVRALAERNRRHVPGIDDVRVTDQSGRVIGEPGFPLHVGDRDYFQASLLAPEALVVSEPLKDRLTGQWGLALSRARSAADGVPRGVVYSHLSTAHLLRSLEQVDAGRMGAVSLRTSSLHLVARKSDEPTPDSAIGSAQVSPGLREAVQKNPVQGFYVSRTAIDGVERANAYRQVDGYPLTVIVGLGTREFFRPWRREAASTIALAGSLAALVVGLSVVVFRDQEKQLAMRGSIQRLLREQQIVLDNELVGMTRVRERVEVWHNKALERMFGYGPGELSSQPSRLLYPDDASHEQIGRAYALLARGEPFRTQLEMRRKDGSLIWVDLSGVELPHGDSLWMMVDITAIKVIEHEARHAAQHDELTGLLNRAGLDAHLAALLSTTREAGAPLALCFIDLDGFKAVNDAHGHDAGDSLLRIAAQRLTACTRSGDVVARLGGDEFVVLLTSFRELAEIALVMQRVVDALSAPVVLHGDGDVHVGASVGVALFPADGEDAATLLAHADMAMYAAKHAGKGCIRYHQAPP